MPWVSVILGHEWKSLVRCDRRISLVGSLSADLLDHPFDRLGRDFQVGHFGQIEGRLLKGGAIDAGVNDSLLHSRDEVGAVKAQRLVLREKKPSGSGGNS